MRSPALLAALLAPGVRRLKAVAAASAFAAVALVTLSLVSPATLTTARERLNSISAYSTDSSVRYRLVESQLVLHDIAAHPVTGSGLGATIFWGQPWAQVPPKTQTFSHDGYLWLAWKVGVPAAALLTLILASALLGRRAEDETDGSIGVRRGRRAQSPGC